MLKAIAHFIMYFLQGSQEYNVNQNDEWALFVN